MSTINTVGLFPYIEVEGENVCPTCGRDPYWEIKDFAHRPGTVFACLKRHEWVLVG